MRRVVISHLRVLFVYLFVITFFRILRLQVSVSLGSFLNLFGFWVGGVIGMVLLDIDRLIHVYVEHPELELSKEVKQKVSEQNWQGAIDTLLAKRFEQNHLAFRSGVFAVIFVPVVFFAFTSASNLFGKGLAAGVMIHFLFDAWRDNLRYKERFNEWILWMVQREIPIAQKRLLLFGLTGVFGLLSLLLV